MSSITCTNELHFCICILRYIKLSIYVSKRILHIILSIGYQTFLDNYIFVIHKLPLLPLKLLITGNHWVQMNKILYIKKIRYI